VSLSKHIVGRLAAMLFLVGGGVSAASLILPSPIPVNRPGLAVVAALALGLGLFAWFAPWHRWRRGATLWLVPPALGLISVSDPMQGRDPYVFGIYFIVVFVWIGVCHRPWTSVRWAPPAAIAYALPLALPGHGPTAFSSTFQVIPLCVLLGEALARVPTQLRRAEAVDLQRMTGMRALVEATELLARESDSTGAADLAAHLAVVLLGGASALAFLLEVDGTLAVAGASRWPGATDGLRIRRGEESALDLAVDTGSAVLSPAAERSPGLTGRGAHGPALILPLSGSSGPLGALAVFLRGEALEMDAFDSYIAQTFATQAGLALERLKATHVLREASMRDELTGLGNRRAASVAFRQMRPGDAVALVDLDRLKEINDEMGHAAGDQALRALAAYLRQALREQDWAIRYGGDEFLLVLTGAGRHAHETIERLAAGWRAASPSSTFAAGVAVHRDGRSPADTVGEADQALYEAKRAGRNRTVIYGEPALRP
jgi:diguanylate cyclase (GGDEF)-like protein